MDLTVPNAEVLQAFYQAVVGWRMEPVAMGEYADFNMLAPNDGHPVAGICHARGMNADLPAQWLMYITVADLETSIQQCVALGGKVLVGQRGVPGHGQFCVIQDPAGAVAALFMPTPSSV
jgi:hypothetical protein